MSDKPHVPSDHQQILRYLRKQMNSEELAQFEVRLMNDTNLLRETQREEALIAALNECQDALVCGETRPRALGFREWLFQPMTAAAALLVMIVSIPMVSLQQSILREQPIESFAIASSQYVEGLRSSTQSLPITADFPLLLNIDAGPDAAGIDFAVQMLSWESEQVIFEEQNLTSNSEGYLSLLLREPISGDYQILVYAGSDPESEATASYRVSIR